ncbi:MAG: bidirectional hydrogenase complex protein HoxE [Caldilineales bacterium]|nr:bidirectional hydrogenase complex protein HoxE [Caldilineales bacterium]
MLGAVARRNEAASRDQNQTDARLNLVDRALKRFQFQQDALIEVLHTAQEAFGFLDEDLLIYVARQLKLPLSWVFGVATFYHFFSLKPQGEHNCIVCMGTACYVKRAAEIVALLQSEYGIEPGQTTDDGAFSLATARCLGSCGLAPVLVVDGEVLGRETPESTLAKLKQILASSQRPVPDAGSGLRLQEATA